MASDLFRRYIWLVDTINRAKRITFEDISTRWMNSSLSDGRALPLRTFHNHRAGIEETFDILIGCHKATNEYFIENPSDLKHAEVSNWLLHTVSVRNLLNEAGALRECLQLEPVPSGERFLIVILHAIRDHFSLRMEYQSYTAEAPSEILLDPYLLKLFRHRWYVLGFNAAYGEIRTYALDRVLGLEVTHHSYVPLPDFDADTHLAHCFGIIDSGEPETILIRVSPGQAHYIRSFPLHHSQKEMHCQAEYSIFRFYMKPTYDLLQEFLSHGAELEVISPETLRKQMSDVVSKMHHRYGNK